MKKIIISIFLSFLLTTLATFLTWKWITGYTIDPSIENSFGEEQIVKLFFIWLVYFLSLVTVPMLWRIIVERVSLKKDSFWKVFMSLELLVITFSYIVTPPDLFSTLLLVIICQPIVVVNILSLKRNLN